MVWHRAVAWLARTTTARLAGKRRSSSLLSLAPDAQSFIVAFCGSGTGHLTQALALVKLLRRAGLTLTGVVTDSDAPQTLLDELVVPLGVPILVLPAVTIVTKNGVVPPYKVAAAQSSGGKIGSPLSLSRSRLNIDVSAMPLSAFSAGALQGLRREEGPREAGASYSRLLIRCQALARR